MCVNVESLAANYDAAVKAYEVFTEILDKLVNDINFGPDISDEGDGWWHDLLNLQTAFTALGRFFPDEEGLKTLFEDDAKAPRNKGF